MEAILEKEIMEDAEISHESSSLRDRETMELLREYKKTGDEALKWEIVLRHESLIRNVAFQVRGIYSGFAQMEDIINEGLITMLKAIDKFDPDMGIKFETFVSKRIRGMVIDLARKQDFVPRSVRKRAKEMDEAANTLANSLGRYPTSQEMAEYLNISKEKYRQELASAAVSNVVSLEALIDGSEYENTAYQVRSKDVSTMPELVLEEREHEQILAEAISHLKEKEQLVLSLYYVENLLLREIAQVMDISEPRVSQIHTSAVKKLRQELSQYYSTGEFQRRKD